jgi:hypothetical protein
MKNMICFVASALALLACQKKDAMSTNSETGDTLIQVEHSIASSNPQVLYDTIINYHPNGKIKEKGIADGKNRTGWWTYYDVDGKLLKKSEFVIRDNQSFLNQDIIYTNEGKINYDLSSFFTIELNDTIKVGKTVGKLKYYGKPKGYSSRFIYIVIDNEYAGNIIKKDTFTDDADKLWFGINAYKKGKLKIKGMIEEELSFVRAESSDMKIERKYKYFEKDLFVK